MSWTQQRLIEWEWLDESCISPILLLELEEDLAHFKKSLQEKVAIDRASAKMFEYTIRGAVNWKVPIKMKPLLSIEHLLLPISFVEDERTIIKFNFTQVLKWPMELKIQKTNEDEVLPKETIVIRKEVISFIKDCIRGDNKLPKPRRLHQLSGTESYLIDFEETVIKEFRFNDIREVPSKIKIVKDSDQDLISEELSVFEEPDVIVAEETEETEKIICKFRFEVDIAEKPLESQELILKVPSWSIESDEIDPSYLQYLEDQAVGENLTRGVEFLVDAPFMSTKPIFKESMTSFEFASSMLSQKYFFDLLEKAELIEIVGAYKEEEVLDETMEDETFEQDTRFTISFTPLKFDDEGMVTTNGSVLAPKPQKEIAVQEAELRDEPSVGANKISNVEDLNIIDISNETTKNDSLDATRMETYADIFVEQTTSVYDKTKQTDVQSFNLTKRSLDDDLDALITKKKRTRTKDHEYDRVELPVLSLLKENKLEILPLVDITPINTTTAAPPLQFINSVEDQLPKSFQVKKTIIMNSSNLSENQHLLKIFDKHCFLDVVEFELGFDQPDFQLSYDSGIALVSSSSIEQADLDGNLCIQDQLIRMKSTVPNLKVVIMISQRSYLKKQILFNFQLALSLIDVKSIVVDESDSLGICEQVCLDAINYSELLTEDHIKIMESSDASFLSDCGINPFGALVVLCKCSILDFVLMNSSERSQIVQLPQKLSELIENLFNICWSFD